MRFAEHGATYLITGWGYVAFADTYEGAVERAMRDSLTHLRPAVIYRRQAVIDEGTQQRIREGPGHDD